MIVAESSNNAETGKNFKEAFGVLQDHADALRIQDEPNIDDLLAIVTESVAAYKVCKERIDAVEAALKAALDGAGVTGAGGQGMAAPSPATGAAPAKKRDVQPQTKQPDMDLDDDIPF